MCSFQRRYLQSKQGFTLIEILIVTGILGVLTGVVTPNVASFINTSKQNAANMELENVKTASIGYYADHQCEWPTDSTQLLAFLSGPPHATYLFDTATGYVIDVDDVFWSDVHWVAPPGPPYTQHGEWVK
jgi:prepilin-type N-terminal cleavage/methylation domain-containing protein